MSCEEDAEMLQRDLDRLSVWAPAWQMQYNVGKCEVIHLGSNNRETDYSLNGCKLRVGYSARPWCPCTSVAESKCAGTAGSKEGKWYVGLHSERL